MRTRYPARALRVAFSTLCKRRGFDEAVRIQFLLEWQQGARAEAGSRDTDGHVLMKEFNVYGIAERGRARRGMPAGRAAAAEPGACGRASACAAPAHRNVALSTRCQ